MLEDLEPKLVFHFFEELTKIPRCSGDEQRVSDYLVGFAKERGLDCVQDEALNVIIKKPGTSGFEHSKAVIIQGHMDMVCERSKGSRHDFDTDALVLKVDGDFVRATDTTLGADNGIAVAYGLALLESQDIPHPPIELLVTTGEETGMHGAAALDATHLSGTTLLNVDAEDEGVLFVSCAGGVDLVCEFEATWEDATAGAVLIEVSGLVGGHSGLEIIKQRANAIKLLARVLDASREAGEFCIAGIAGGTKSNAIAREAHAIVSGDGAVLRDVTSIAESMADHLKTEFGTVDPGIRVTVSPIEKVPRQLDRASSQRIIDFLVAVPHGVQSVSKELVGLVESSLNMGVLTTSGESIRMTVSVRSSVGSIREDITRRVEILSRLVAAKCTRANQYPAWQYEADSRIRDLCVRVYKELTGTDAQIQAIHAGLECGLLKQKLPQTDMISFGPNLSDVHTPGEQLSISSVANTWGFLTAVLAELK